MIIITKTEFQKQSQFIRTLGKTPLSPVSPAPACTQGKRPCSFPSTNLVELCQYLNFQGVNYKIGLELLINYLWGEWREEGQGSEGQGTGEAIPPPLLAPQIQRPQGHRGPAPPPPHPHPLL